MKPIGLIIFDLDGTLVNTLDDITASVNHTLAQLRERPVTRDAVRGYVGDGIEMLLQRARGGKRSRLAEAVSVYKDHHRRHLMVRSTLYPSVEETLEHFKSLPLAVLSNKAGEFVGPLLDGLGIGRYFKLVIGADSGLPLKPAPDALQKIMAELAVPKDRTVIVGDGTTDVRAGKAAGVITCAVTYGYRSEDELRQAGPDYLVPAFSELRRLFTPTGQ